MRKMLHILGAAPLWRISLRPASAAASLAAVYRAAAETPRLTRLWCEQTARAALRAAREMRK